MLVTGCSERLAIVPLALSFTRIRGEATTFARPSVFSARTITSATSACSTAPLKPIPGIRSSPPVSLISESPNRLNPKRCVSPVKSPVEMSTPRVKASEVSIVTIVASMRTCGRRTSSRWISSS